MRKIGILGGTFNPVHVGHLMLAECARDTIGLDEVWFIPTGQSYKKNDLPGEERLNMVQMAIAGNPAFCCLDLEIRRGGYTYTYETIEQLRDMYPGEEFYFIAGADCLETIEQWKCPERIFKGCTLAAAVRGHSCMEEMERLKGELVERFCARIILLPFLEMSLSSTQIRERVRKGQSIRYLVPDSVSDYIKEKGFYREER